MKKISLAIVAIFVFACSFSQELLKESIIQQKDEDVDFYKVTGFHFVPEVIDAGEGGFVITYIDKIIAVDNDLNKKWESPLFKFEESSHSNAHNISRKVYNVANQNNFYNISVYSNPHLSPDRIEIATYNMENGNSRGNIVSIEAHKGVYLTDFIALSDGVYCMKVEVIPHSGKFTQYLCKINGNNLVQKKLPLPFSDEEMAHMIQKHSYHSWRHFPYRIIGLESDKIYLMKGYYNSLHHGNVKRQEDVKITLGILDKDGTFNTLSDTSINNFGNSYPLSMPMAKVDTLNKTIYVSGFKMGGAHYNGLYSFVFDLKSGKSNVRTMSIKNLSDSLKLSEDLTTKWYLPNRTVGLMDNIIVDINLDIDIYNKCHRIIMGNPEFLKYQMGSVYFNNEIRPVEISNLAYTGVGNVRKNILYSDQSRALLSAVDYYEANCPHDENRVYDFCLNRKDHSVLVQVMESKSQILVKKFNMFKE